MRFEPRKKRLANPVGRSESRTLFVFVMLLGFVVVMIGKAMDPDTWAWFAGREASQPEHLAEDEPQDPDTRIAMPVAKSRLEGQFTMPLAVQIVETVPDVPGYFSGVKPALLTDVEDGSEFNSDELAPRMNLIEVLRRSKQDELTKASKGEVSFRQIFDQPEIYRGKLVTIAGSVKQAQFEDSTVADGVDRYFVMWIKLKSGPERPVAVYSLEKPSNFPEGKDLNESVRVTGFFFKKRAYKAQDTFRVAPVILAKSFAWKPVAKEEKWVATNQQLAWMFGGAVVFAILVAAIAHYRTNRLFITRRNQDAAVAVDDKQVLPSVGEQLSELVDQESK